MNEKSSIEKRKIEQRFIHELKRRNKKKKIRRIQYENYLRFKKGPEGQKYRDNIVSKWLPPNISYLISCKESDFYIDKLKLNIPKNGGVFKVPREFSLIDNPKESYKFLSQLTAVFIDQSYPYLKIDYRDCKSVDLGAQVFLDIIIKDIITFYNRCTQYTYTKPRVKSISGINVNDKDIGKLLFSVGSPAIHANRTIKFDDIIPYKLCIHNREKDFDPVKLREQKDIDTTTLVDYVQACLKRLNKTLSPDKLYDLCTVIGEILINAEEHSTTKYRFSIGYFHEQQNGGKHLGVFRLVIMNFGSTIYEKFKDPECPNSQIVNKMRALSENYTRKNFFSFREFEEETLWTLYALQEGVTSVAPDKYVKRGNGSIQFIESFFNLKGEEQEADKFSRMIILSGQTNITFDGTYRIFEAENDNEKFKLMTFNNSRNIEDRPDSKYVKFVSNYFPGTIISAKILLNEDDMQNETK